jgi:hypothetical protein
MPTCLFCSSTGPFSTTEHIIPESLGNDDLLLKDGVCDSCQSYFGKEVEQFVLGKTPLAFWRTFLGIKTKKGKNPSVNLSQPKTDKGVLRSVHSIHDNMEFTYHDDGSISFDANSPELREKIRRGEKNKFMLVFTPKILHMLGRFFCKIGLELISLDNPDFARSEIFKKARRYARFGEFDGLWPIFHFSKGEPSDLHRYRKDKLGWREDVNCYSYSLFVCNEQYWLFLFSMGTDNWIVSLNDPFPPPIIQEAFPNDKLSLIWYTPQELGG